MELLLIILKSVVSLACLYGEMDNGVCIIVAMM